MRHGLDPFGPSKISISSAAGLGFVVLPRRIQYSKSRAGSSEKTSLVTHGTRKQSRGGMLTVTQNQGRVENWTKARILWCSASILKHSHNSDLDTMTSEVMQGNDIMEQKSLPSVLSSFKQACLHGETIGLDIIHSRFRPFDEHTLRRLDKYSTSIFQTWHAEDRGRNSVAG